MSREQFEAITGVYWNDATDHQRSLFKAAWQAAQAAAVPEGCMNLDTCPNCGGHADNGHDRCVPPTAYLCSACMLVRHDESIGLYEPTPQEQKVVAISDRKHDAWDEAKAAIAKALGLTPNAEFSGGAPLHGAASAGTQGYASGERGYGIGGACADTSPGTRGSLNAK